MKKRCSMVNIHVENILLIYKWTSSEALEYSKKIIEHLMTFKLISKFYVETIENFTYLNNNDDIKIYEYNSKINSTIDLVIVLGGDGTVLWANHLFGNDEKPGFLNFNLGTIGYLAYYDVKEYKNIFEEIFINECKVISYENRSTIQTLISSKNKDIDGKLLNSLNDIIFGQIKDNKMIKINIYIDDKYLSDIRSDGIIVSTPTGSTAYSLSAGGPIIHPDLEAIVMTSICPFTLSFRPIVLSKEYSLKLVVDESVDKAQICSDGIDTFFLTKGDYLEIKISKSPCKIMILDNIIENPITNWKNKLIKQLGWSNAINNN